MPYYCTVPRCTSMAGKAKNVSFHQFPRDEELARLWNDILKRGKPYTKYSKVCSLHFRPEDYTITSVGKNKGQWRTLRKDAVPSRNLPSESPAPYSRKQWESWSQNNCTPSVIDPTIHQQMAQAIYMQTMLAMQAAGTVENPHQNGSAIPGIPAPHTSSQEDKLNSKHNKDSVSYKCEECTKCFKDPDVFMLHKRSHSRDLKSNGVEKENFNMNLTLRSNPILANLLKTNNEANFDPNIITMENLLMSALAANMDYLRNYPMGKERECDMNQDRDLNNSRELSGSETNYGDDDNHLSDDKNNHLSDDKKVLSYTQCLNNSKNDVFVDKCTSDLNHGNDVSVSDQNEQSHHSKSDNHSLRKSEQQQKSDLNLHNSDEPIGLSYAMNFSTKLSDRESLKYNGNYYRERLFSSEHENEDNSEDNIENVRSHCDNELNESMDSNSLVIDENA